jgi:DNA processing protein
MDERMYWLGFSVAPHIGPKRFAAIITAFGSAQNAWNASEADMASVIGKIFTKKFTAFKNTFSLRLYVEALWEKDINYLTLPEDLYPKLLKQIPNPPFVLYVKGAIETLNQIENEKFLGVVGTRRITSYGKTVTEMITGELVDNGFTIVSGLALGVDAVAHKTTIERGGKTIAVLGCGVDCCTPSANQSLYNSIIDGTGCIISESRIGMLPTVGSFPSRNRIIAGLSQALIVTEGAEDSGSLITASKTREFGRPLFAVPGPITSSLSRGPNKLLAEGARMVTSGEDILRDLGVKQRAKGKEQGVIKGDTKEEQRIIDLLQNEPLHFDEIVKQTGFDSSQIGILLSLMEMKGLIENGDEGYLIKSS